MLVIKTQRNKLFFNYLTWLNPILKLSKGEQDILASLLTLHYAHRHYPAEKLNELLTSPQTLEAIRKKIRINSKLFNKLFNSLKERKLVGETGLHHSLINYPRDGKFKLFVSFEIVK